MPVNNPIYLYHYSEDPVYEFDFTDSSGAEIMVNFDFCESLPTEYQCESQDTLASQHQSDSAFNDTCINLTKKPGSSQSVSLVETDNEKDEHLKLTYTVDKECTASSNATNYGIVFEVLCDSSIKDQRPKIERIADLSNDCVQYVQISHDAGCKVGDLNGLWRFVEDNAWIFCIVFMVVGAFYTVFGLKLLRPTLFIIGTLTTMVIILFLFYVLILPNNVKEWAGWVILACSAILGLIVGFFAAKLVRIGAFILGAWAGAAIGLLLSNMAFYKIDSEVVLWVLIILLALIVGLLSFVFFNFIVIFSTSFLGGYLLMRGLSLVAGGYPNEFTVYERIRDGDLDSVPGTFYAYMVGVVIFAAAGMYLQLRMLSMLRKSSVYTMQCKLLPLSRQFL